jgi:APA family basic amino acid/polyamine antiporter
MRGDYPSATLLLLPLPRLGIFLRPKMASDISKQAVSTWPAAALVVSNMIGIGVFTSLGFQLDDFTHHGSQLSGSVLPIILLWIVGGILAVCGALCYAELATALPRSGGEYNFLSRIYHPVVGFCTGLCSATIGFAAPIAISAQVFSQYLLRAFPSLNGVVPNNTGHAIALLLVIAVTAVHLRSLHVTGAFQAAATGMTILLILVFIVVGFSHGPAQPVTFLPHRVDANLGVLAAFWGSLIWVMYSYSGWNAAAYIVEEVRDPARMLPRALILGTLFVVALYVAVNAVFLYTTPIAALSGQLEVAHISGVQIFGPAGARIASGLICVGLVANVSGMIWVGSRVTEAIGATYPRLSMLGRTTQTRVPFVALIYQFAIVCCLLFFKPENIMNYVGSVLLFWSLLAVVGVIVLRVREPELARPYRTWGYPFTPILFAAITICCLVKNSELHSHETLIGTVTVLIGIPVWLWASRNVSDAQLRGETVPQAST